jgi:hypothetical protein
MSSVFIAMGETGALHFDPTNSSTHGDWQTFGPIPITVPTPASTTMRYIITPSDRYTPGFFNPDRAFPVGGIGYETGPTKAPGGKLVNPINLIIHARNSDTAANGGYASFFWLAIDEGQGPISPAGIPLNQKLIGQPANFVATKNTGDHQVLPNIFNPANPAQASPPAVQLQGNPPYSFVSTIGTTVVSTFGTAPFKPLPAAPPSVGRPLVFVTANNAGCGVSPNLAHNAAAVALVADHANTVPMTSTGFKLIARNTDIAGACGFNWVALLPTTSSLVSRLINVPPGAPQPLDLLVDTGTCPAPVLGPFYFNAVGTSGDWASAEVQFNAPFAAEPVVLLTPQFPQPYLPNPPETNYSSCAPVGIVQNVTRYGFTLAARNSDTNNTGGQASFYWVAFGLPD